MYFRDAGPANYLEAMLRRRIQAARGDRGASALEWVLISGALIIICALVGGIIYNKVKTASDGLIVNPNTAGGGGGGGGNGP